MNYDILVYKKIEVVNVKGIVFYSVVIYCILIVTEPVDNDGKEEMNMGFLKVRVNLGIWIIVIKRTKDSKVSDYNNLFQGIDFEKDLKKKEGVQKNIDLYRL